MLSVSSHGAANGTGILWASYASSGDAEHVVSPGILGAFDANDVNTELWKPTIANGHVYLPTFSNRVVVYGLQ